jgi:hypothetical protein
MNKQEQVKYYWQRIDKQERRIEELANRGLSYHYEMQKRKSLLNNVKRLENEQN